MRTIDAPIQVACVALLCAALAACGDGGKPVPAQPAPPPAELHVGALHIRASTVNTTLLPEQVTRQYGIARGEQTWMLLVTVRTGKDEASETSMPANVEAFARDLQGRRIEIPLRELETAQGLVDHVGTFSIAPPDTLQFTVQVTPQGGPTRTLEFAREVAR